MSGELKGSARGCRRVRSREEGGKEAGSQLFKLSGFYEPVGKLSYY